MNGPFEAPNALDIVQPGDALMITRVDRLARGVVQSLGG